MKNRIDLPHSMDIVSDELSRRDVLKEGIGLGAALAGLGAASGHAATGAKIDNSASSGGGPDHKIRPPADGCLVGFYKPDPPSDCIRHYRTAFGANPSLFAVWSHIAERLPMIGAGMLKERGMLPYIVIYPGVARQLEKYEPGDIVNGQCDRYIKGLANDAVTFGKKHGSFFFTTMVEPNTDWWYWSRKPNIPEAVRHFWEIFEDQGANRYATWTWEAFCPTRYGFRVDDPEPYYPGDKYVDWIGLNVFANLKNKYIREDTMFRDLLSKPFERMVANHPGKPMMVSEFGRTPGENQPPWLIDAFRSIKNEYPKIKAAIWYDNITAVHGGQDHTLDRRSLNTLKEIFKDPYWKMVS